MYFCTSINVWNLFKVLGGTNLRPLSNTAFSVSVRTTLLKLKIPVPLRPFSFFDRARRPPLDPRLDFFPWGSLPGPCENPLDIRT